MLVVACWLDDWIAMVEVWSVVRLAAAAEYRDLLPPVHPGHQSRQTEETFLFLFSMIRPPIFRLQ